MNTQEKYLAGYVFEALTGIKGENQEWVYQIIEKSDFQMSDPFVQMLYDIAKTNPRDEQVKDVVAGLAIGYILMNNKLIQSAMEDTINTLVQKKIAEKEAQDKPEYKDIYLSYDIEDETFFACLWYKNNMIGTIKAPAEKGESIISKFQKRFPSAQVISL